MFGLIKAIDNFDVSLNVQFSTYAVPMIIGEIRRYLRDNNPIRVSRSVRDLAYRALQAKEKIIKEKQNEPTVEEIAKELGVTKEEVVMSLDAIQDPVSLQEPYAVPMIIGEIRRYLRDNNPIRVSRSVRDLAYRALQAKEKIIKEKQNEPTVEEIAKELGVTKEEVVMSLDAIQDPVSLQEPVYNEGSESIYIMDQVKDSKNTDELWAENITVAEAMKKLNKREKTIISKRFFDGRTQMEVAEEIGISQAQVSRLEKSAIERIKKMYK